MTNLEAKKEAIKKAYGEYWENVKDYVDKNGWCFNRRNVGFKEIISKLSWETKIGNSYYWRPKSLKGKENNNGWIKIESESDLPNIYDKTKFELYTYKTNGVITHYQLKPIKIPKPPIF